MSKKDKKKNDLKTSYELLKEMRGDWGDINPVTKTIENKKAYKRKEKYPKDYFEDDDEYFDTYEKY